MKNKILSAALSLLTAFSALPVYANAADETETLPKWVPQEFGDAAEFMNKYGKTFVKDDYVCYVDIMRKGKEYFLDLPDEPNYIEPLSRQVYSGKSGLDTPKYDYVVYCFRLPAESKLEFTFTSDDDLMNGAPHKYTFESDAKGKVTETDFYAYVPDCIIEFNDFVLKNGTVSTVNDTVLTCLSYNPSLGIGLLPETYGKGTLELVSRSDVMYYSSGELNADGAAVNNVCVFKPVHSGTVCAGQVKMYYAKEPETRQYIEGWFSIDDELKITEIDEKTFFDDNRGDINGDGRLTIADVYVFEQWLMGSQKQIPVNLKAADLCTDGVYDVYDLIMLKKELLGSSNALQSITADYVYSSIDELKTAVKVGISEEEMTEKGEAFAEAVSRIKDGGLTVPMSPGINFDYPYTYRAVTLDAEGLCGQPTVSLYPLDLEYIDCVQVAPLKKELCKNITGERLKVIVVLMDSESSVDYEVSELTFADSLNCPSLLDTDGNSVTFITNDSLIRIVYDPEKCDGKNMTHFILSTERMK